ncbi:hypothetical protein DWU98_09115 [Dyella monticola]|uniref:CENP-V/GFA domain-containing protein n=1 Tax=Dyella monticola TaxID=1927958 RepID=A0A370X1R2_9GAMM|nr:hypothetical protein [Dyella monticola]RDS82191.1 hypothetical protein DWU98_09115 [Dyella monticola]
MLIAGSCHCGNIRFVLEWTPDPVEIPARACTCTFCSKHGGVWTSHPAGSLKVTIRDPAHASRYAFGTETADFHVCAMCGVVPLATCAMEGSTYAVVNVNSFENVPPSLLQRSSSTVDGESMHDRLARRKRNWIANVQFV